MEDSIEMPNRNRIEELCRKHGFEEFRWLPAADIVVAQWVRMKCHFGCDEYGTSVTCPPNLPPISECERLIKEYSESLIFHFPKTVGNTEERMAWSREVDTRLIALERDVFLGGYYKTFALIMCSCPVCKDCVAKPEDCRHPGSARPMPEGMGIDVFATARSVGYPVEVLTDQSQKMNRFAILLIE